MNKHSNIPNIVNWSLKFDKIYELSQQLIFMRSDWDEHLYVKGRHYTHGYHTHSSDLQILTLDESQGLRCWLRFETDNDPKHVILETQPKDETHLPTGALRPYELECLTHQYFSIKIRIAAKYLHTHDKIQIEDIMNRSIINNISNPTGIRCKQLVRFERIGLIPSARREWV